MGVWSRALGCGCAAAGAAAGSSMVPAELEADPGLDDARGQHRSEERAIGGASRGHEIDEPAVGIEQPLAEVIEERRLAGREHVDR